MIPLDVATAHVSRHYVASIRPNFRCHRLIHIIYRPCFDCAVPLRSSKHRVNKLLQLMRGTLIHTVTQFHADRVKNTWTRVRFTLPHNIDNTAEDRCRAARATAQHSLSKTFLFFLVFAPDADRVSLLVFVLSS